MDGAALRPFWSWIQALPLQFQVRLQAYHEHEKILWPLQASDVLCRVISLVQLRQAEVDIERVLKVQMVLTALLMLPVIYYLAVPWWEWSIGIHLILL